MSGLWKTFLSFPLACREGEIALTASGPISMEDLEHVILCLKIHTDAGRWPGVGEVRRYESCTACQWLGKASKRVPREGEGRTGCPECGAKTEPRFQAPEASSVESRSRGPADGRNRPKSEA